MNFNAPLLKPVRILLFPFSLVYGGVVWVRNKFFDKGWIGSTSFNLPIIGVGNLSAGGTGKSPMVEFLVKNFKTRYKVAVLSRGYKRKTAGYTIASDKSTALDIGDEPMLLHRKHPDVTVAVGEERIVAIPQMLQDKPDTDLIVLDDAFQHRYVKAGFEILLTEFGNLFTQDWFLPTGDLRDLPSSYKRAQVIIVTKCPNNLSFEAREKILGEIKPGTRQSVFFTCIEYGVPYHLITGEERKITEHTEVLLVSGIANPRPLKKYLQDNTSTYYEILYDDHHIFTIEEVKEMRRIFENISTSDKIILTTEKDAMRLLKFGDDFKDYPFYVIPIDIRFLFGEEQVFIGLISNFISGFRNDKQMF